MRLRTSLIPIVAAGVLAGCSAGSDELRHENEELRRMLIETRTDLEAVKHDQEQLRATMEYLQYSRGAAANAAAQAPRAPERWPADPWGGGAPPDPFSRPTDLESLEPGQPVPSRPPAAQPPGASPQAAAPQMGVPHATAPQASAQAPITAPSVSASASVQTAPAPENPRVASARPAAPASGTETAPPVVPQNLSGTLYEDGVRAFNAGRYDDAVQKFRDYIHDEPQSQYADDAQFWIGESALRKGQYSNAIKEFNQVVLRYASGDRSAASLLKLADVFSRIGDQVDARLSLQKLVNRYPGSAEAAEAYRLLQEMGG